MVHKFKNKKINLEIIRHGIFNLQQFIAMIYVFYFEYDSKLQYEK